MLNDKIKSRIEEKYGSQIRYSKDCEALASHISSMAGCNISASTVKRLFGFIKSTSKPSQYTLDTIASYLGYVTWEELNAKLLNINFEPIEQVEQNNKRNEKDYVEHSSILKNKYSRFGLASIIILISLGLLLVYFNGFSDNFSYKWKQLSSLPEVRNGGKVINYNDKIFYIGGADAEFVRDNTWLYNVKNNIWIEKAKMPTPRGEMGCVLVGKRIYCFGGWRGNKIGPTDIAEIYDIENNTWNNLPKLPKAIVSVSAVSIKNQIYILGGTLGETKTYFFRFNTETSSYDSLSVFNVDRMYVCLVEVNNKIIAIGGNSFKNGQYNFHDEVDEYNPANDVWTKKARIPTAITRSSAVLKGKEIHFFGGTNMVRENSEGIKNYHFVYNTENNSWNIEKPLPFNICCQQTICFNGKIILLGGTSDFPNPSKKVYIEY